ncbi:MAG: ABC transporter permease [Candidatus Cryptobacteroides sp.]
MWKHLLIKEFKQFFRDPGLPRMVLMFPLLIVFVFPFAVSMEIRNIILTVVDCDKTPDSALLIEKCTKSGYFKLREICEDPSYAEMLMDKGQTDAILTVNAGFSDFLGDNAPEGTPLPVGIKINAVNGTKGAIGSQYLSACVTSFISSRKAGAAMTSGPVISASEDFRYNQYMDYKVFMVPALIVIAITMMCGFMPSLNIVSEKEKGTIEQINVTPVSKSAFIICKMVPYIAVAFFMLGTCLLLARITFGYTCQGSLLNICLYTFAHIVVMASFGLLVSNYSENTQQAMFVMWFFSVLFMLMSGIFTPISSMPEWAQYITLANPLRYFADAMRAIYLKGGTLLDTWKDLAGLCAIGCVTLTWSILSYKKTN